MQDEYEMVSTNEYTNNFSKSLLILCLFLNVLGVLGFHEWEGSTNSTN